MFLCSFFSLFFPLCLFISVRLCLFSFRAIHSSSLVTACYVELHNRQHITGYLYFLFFLSHSECIQYTTQWSPVSMLPFLFSHCSLQTQTITNSDNNNMSSMIIVPANRKLLCTIMGRQIQIHAHAHTTWNEHQQYAWPLRGSQFKTKCCRPVSDKE